jgi:hypothetical protein
VFQQAQQQASERMRVRLLRCLLQADQCRPASKECSFSAASRSAGSVAGDVGPRAAEITDGRVIRGAARGLHASRKCLHKAEAMRMGLMRRRNEQDECCLNSTPARQARERRRTNICIVVYQVSGAWCRRRPDTATPMTVSPC